MQLASDVPKHSRDHGIFRCIIWMGWP